MADQPPARSPLAELCHQFNNALSQAAEGCKTSADLADLTGVIAEMQVYLSRAMKAAVVAQNNGGKIPLPLPGGLTAAAFAVLDSTADPDHPQLSSRLAQMLHTQESASTASADAYGVLAEKAGTWSSASQSV